MGSVDVTICRHRHKLITTFITTKSHFVISLGVTIGQADNIMLNVMQSVPAHMNNMEAAQGANRNRNNE